MSLRAYSDNRLPRQNQCWKAMFLAIFTLGYTALSTAQTSPKAHAIVIEAMQYVPASLEVHVGDTVTWKNKDPFPHTATTQNRGFDSHSVQSGASWRWKAKEKGVFPYICTLHPNMKATLIVK